MHFLGQPEDHYRFPIQHTSEQTIRREFGTKTNYILKYSIDYKLLKKKKKIIKNKQTNNKQLLRYNMEQLIISSSFRSVQ